MIKPQPLTRFPLSLLAGLIQVLTMALVGTAASAQTLDQLEGRIIRDVRISCDGPLNQISPEDLETLILLNEGEVLDLSQAHHSIARLFATEIFHDIQIRGEAIGTDQVDVTVDLIRRFKVAGISFSGQTEINTNLLRRELAFREGEPFSNRGAQETVRRLGELYKRQGYFSSQTEPGYEVDFANATIQINYNVNAGPRTTVRELDFDISGSIRPESVESLVKLKKGEFYSEALRDQDLESLREHLALIGYFRPEIYLRNGIRYDATSNSVALTFRIVTHERTNLEIRGIQLQRKDLARLPLFSERTIGDLPLEETANRITTDLQSQGYLLADVKISALGEKRSPESITIEVDQGKKYELRGIRFEGNQSAATRNLISIMATQKPGAFGKGNLSGETMASDMERIRFYYEQLGFLETEVTPRYDTEDGKLVLVYVINEGVRSRVRHITVIGNQEVSTETILAEMSLEPGGPFSPYALAQNRVNILSLYSNLGYIEADLDPELTTPEPGQVDISYRIEEGKRYFVSDVVVVGNVKTRRGVIFREILSEPGTPYSVDRNLRSETNLYDLSIFRKVNLSDVPDHESSQNRTLIFSVDEARKYTLLYGLGYSYNFEGIKAEGLRGTFGMTVNNLRGSSNSLAFSLRAGATRQRGNLSYRMARLLGRKSPTIFSLTVDNDERIESAEDGVNFRGRPYNSFRAIASAQTERVLSRRESLFFRYNFERVLLNLPEDLDVPPEFYREEDNLLLSSLSMSYLNESRDQPADPRSGFFVSGDLKLASKFIGSQEQFIRFFAQGHYYHPVSRLWRELILAVSLRLGVIRPYGSPKQESRDERENEVAISERFFAGGPTTLRGLPLDLAGPLLRDPETGEVILVDRGKGKLTPVPLGGNALTIANAELRFPIYRFIGGNLFYDVGNVFPSLVKTGPVKLSHAVGFGLSINTPIGPARIDAAYNPNPPGYEGYSRWNFFLNIGHPF